MKQATSAILAMLSLSLIAACGDAGTEEDAGPPAPTMASLGTAEVVISALDSTTARLDDGGAVSMNGTRMALLAAYTAVGDYDSDGEMERAALVTAEPGGDAVWMNLVGFRLDDAGTVQVADKFLGDGPEIHRFETVGDSLLIEITSADRRAQQIYRIEDGTWRLWRDNTITSPPAGGSSASSS